VNILQPGPGVGGHCIAVDPWFIVSKTPEEAQLIRTAREVNDSKPEWVIARIQQAISECLSENPAKRAEDIRIACFGLAFKPDIDDLRESPALSIACKIAGHHVGSVWVVEPNITNLPQSTPGGLTLKSQEDALAHSDIKVLLVDHIQFKNIDMPKGKVLDFKGIWKNN
jgi:UDP-N-acetyl-D-mannosaminuronic acid dehydrogenase